MLRVLEEVQRSALGQQASRIEMRRKGRMLRGLKAPNRTQQGVRIWQRPHCKLQWKESPLEVSLGPSSDAD